MSLAIEMLSADEKKTDSAYNEVDAKVFLDTTPEDTFLNQYWYSKATIDVFCNAIIECLSTLQNGKVAFLSTPSLYFALPARVREHCYLFDYDSKLESDPRFVLYDYNKPNEVASSLRGRFDMVVLDPPFINREVWEKYAITVQALLKRPVKEVPPGYFLGTTVAENGDIMFKLFDAKPTVFRPSIPNLVYQYNTFCNFPSRLLSLENEEVK